jgi:hypothetical protein
MKDDYTSMIDAARRKAEMRPEPAEQPAAETEEEIDFAPESDREAYSILSADRMRKVMVEFRLLAGNAKALAYSYLVRADFNPSEGITLDFTGYDVTITGRNLRPVFEGLVAQRIAVVREMDELQAEAEQPSDATVVTSIEIKPVD